MATISSTSSNVGIFKPHTSGREPSKDVPTIVFLSGWPDVPKSWTRLAPQFEETHHVVTLCLPDYEEPKLKRFWGYSLDEMTKGLALVIEPYYKLGSPIHLVGHDWGAWISLLYAEEFGVMVDKMVLLDVGLRSEFEPLALCYMAYLALVFVVSRFSDTIGLIMIALYPWKWIGPEIGNLDTPLNRYKIKAFMCYPYFRVPFSKIPKFVDTMPQLYLFGGKKRFMFHSQEYLHQLKMAPQCEFKEFPDCGHWLHWSRPKEVGEEIKRFLRNNAKK